MESYLLYSNSTEIQLYAIILYWKHSQLNVNFVYVAYNHTILTIIFANTHLILSINIIAYYYIIFYLIFKAIFHAKFSKISFQHFIMFICFAFSFSKVIYAFGFGQIISFNKDNHVQMIYRYYLLNKIISN